MLNDAQKLLNQGGTEQLLEQQINTLKTKNIKKEVNYESLIALPSENFHTVKFQILFHSFTENSS